MSNVSFLRRSQAFALVFILAAGMVGLSFWQTGAVGDEPAPVAKAAEKHVEQARDLSKAFKYAAGKALPTVVTIKSKIKPKVPFKGTPFEDFFGGELGEMPRQGLGSGVIIDKSGIVLTNNHVVQGADEVIVHLPDGREFKADEIKTDEQTDLAVLRIKGAGSLPAAPLGDSEKMEIGDWVLAIGAPFELEQTVSQGIISGKGRELGAVRRANFLQTDAAINPGNSGGPLVNLDGEVIGINTAIATATGSFSGIGFAIPINTAKWVTGQLIDKGIVQRAYLGVEIQAVNNEVAGYFNAKSGGGVLVANVLPGTPAADAGLQYGDIILRFAGNEVHSPRELQELVERAPVGSKQKLEVLRDGKRNTLELVAKALPKDIAAAQRNPRRGGGDSEAATYENDAFGLEVSDVPSAATDIGKKAGVMIVNVDPEKIAAEKGLRRGMVILSVGRTPVKNVEDFKKAMEKSGKQGVLLLVRTDTGQRYLSLQP